MKLLLCPICEDVVKLGRGIWRRCRCGKSAGRYLDDGIHAELTGSAIPIGFDSTTLARALGNRPEEGMGKRFDAFVIANKCDTISYK